MKLPTTVGSKLEIQQPLLDSGSGLTWMEAKDWKLLKGTIKWRGTITVRYGNGEKKRFKTEMKEVQTKVIDQRSNLTTISLQIYSQPFSCTNRLVIGRDDMRNNLLLYDPVGNTLICAPSSCLQNGGVLFGFNRQTFHNMVEEVKAERSLLDWLTKEYPTVFTKPTEQDLNPAKRVKVRLRPGAPASLRVPPLRMGAKQADILESIIKQLVDEGKLERGTSPYQSPAFIVTKANGSPRLVVDYRRANEITVPEAYPLRRVEDIIQDQYGMRYWSQVDLADAFWQLHLDESSRDILAIATKSGSYRWIALPQGWHSSPIHFQAFVDSLFANVEGVHTYQDDLILSTATRSGMVKLVKQVFYILSKNSLYVKQEKVKLMQTNCNILGFNVSFNQVMPTEALVKKIVSHPRPRNMTELKGFLGLTNFYHDLIPEYTTQLLPLSRLAQEKVPWRWTKHQEETFQHVKTMIQSPELQVCLPDPRKPFIMYVDSSTYAYGAALFQKNGDRILPISYFSGGYKPAERNYDIGALELLALRKACAHWKVLLEHNYCDIYTDNSPLSHLLNKDLNQCTKKERKTISELATYRLKIHHLKGAKNQLADYLSRRDRLRSSICAHDPQCFKQDIRAWCHSHKADSQEISSRATPRSLIFWLSDTRANRSRV